MSGLIKRSALAAIAFGLASSLCSGAFAQTTNCISSTNTTGVQNLDAAAAINSAVSAAFVSSISQINTAFISQQGSAFVSSPPNPGPDQPGGGVWVRGVGGEVNTKSVTNSTSTVATTGVPAPPAPGATPVFPAGGTGNGTVSTSCLSSQRTDFGGVQVGQDISRLNWGGWNIHLGTTAGYVSARTTGNGFTTDFDVPFVGGYLAATYGRFFADLVVREDFFNASMSNPTFSIPSTPVGAHGVSVSTSAGYNFALANNWFIEPSAGFIWSNIKVDPFTQAGSVGPPPAGIIPATAIATSDIISEIGRLSLRGGTTIDAGNVTWQPFASVSVFHEFAGSVTSGAQTNQAFLNGAGFLCGGVACGAAFVAPTSVSQQSSTSRIGTYGQYSLGLAGVINNTGWLGFVRVDYRNGSNIDGWAGNAGIRYQFTPETIAAVMPTKAPVKAVPVVAPVNWTGFYVGGFLGGAYGRSDIRFDPTGVGNNPWVFGGLGGGQIGYNYQMNSWVFGVEGDIGGTNLHGARTCGNSIGRDATTFAPVFFSPFLLTCGDSMNWIATAAARVGWAYGRTLWYVKGGGAWADESTSIGCVISPANNSNPGFNNFCRNPANVITNGFSTSGNRAGWTVGFGSEFDLGKNWSAKAEYDYIDFGNRTALATDGTTVLRTSTTVSEVKIGVNYRFGPGLVVAKY
jgi:opacity protein-like surface antigen